MGVWKFGGHPSRLSHSSHLSHHPRLQINPISQINHVFQINPIQRIPLSRIFGDVPEAPRVSPKPYARSRATRPPTVNRPASAIPLTETCAASATRHVARLRAASCATPASLPLRARHGRPQALRNWAPPRLALRAAADKGACLSLPCQKIWDKGERRSGFPTASTEDDILTASTEDDILPFLSKRKGFRFSFAAWPSRLGAIA